MTAYTPINIILADDHEIFRDGFSVMLNKVPEINLVDEAANGAELIRLALKHKPDVIVTDIRMPVMDGIEATKILKDKLPCTGIIALSMYDQDELIVEMLEAGAKGYLLKNAHKNEIISAVKTVNENQPFYCKETTHKLTQMIANSTFNPYKKIQKPDFNQNELTVMRYICQELSNKQIADLMNLSKRTIEGYREKIVEKTEAKNTVGIVMYAIKNKIVECK